MQELRMNDGESERLLELLCQLPNPDTRLHAMRELEKLKNCSDVIAPLLWCSFGCISALIQELIMVYQYLNPQNINKARKTRILLVLSLFQMLAQDPKTQSLFIKSNLVLFLYPLLESDHYRPCEFLRLSTLGVIACLVAADNSDIITYLLNTDIFSNLIKLMETSSDLTKTAATYAFLRVISYDQGLNYVCSNQCRLSSTAVVLGRMIYSISKRPSVNYAKLVKHVIRCYIRILEDYQFGRPVMLKTLPDQLTDTIFEDILEDDHVSKGLLHQLICLIRPSSQTMRSVQE